jgi:hypothetical protein
MSMVCRVLCSKSILTEIIVHKADEPNAVIDFLETELLAGEDG